MSRAGGGYRASLRLRLLLTILGPLVVMAIGLGLWRVTVAQRTAQELFDRSLLSAALAISRDVAVSEGDALSASTRDLIRDAAGGEVFYHATGPGGIYVTGYAYPPFTRGELREKPGQPTYFTAIYRGEPVQVLRLTERVTIGTLTGDMSVTVWQRLSDRNAFARQLAWRAVALMGALLAALALLVWFGVKLGLSPLADLQNAIAARSPDDLRSIKRAVPVETQAIVDTLNRLFGQVDASLKAQHDFISDAAHQLRNPTAAVRSMAESLREARTEAERRQRTAELVSAAGTTSRLIEQLLSLERLQQDRAKSVGELFDLNDVVQGVCAEFGPAILRAGLTFEFDAAPDRLPMCGERFFVSEAVKNLIDNAQEHGGPDLTRIRVRTRREGQYARVTVFDDGKTLSPGDAERAFRRFGQLEPSHGSGLGLAIVGSVAQRHGGKVEIDDVGQGASLSLSLPLALEPTLEETLS